MPSPLARAVGRVAERVGPLRNIPVVRLVILAEVMMLARDHLERLTPKERRRLVLLVREGRGRPQNLSERKRAELEALLAKADPKLFASEAMGKLSPVPLPRRFTPSADDQKE